MLFILIFVGRLTDRSSTTTPLSFLCSFLSLLLFSILHSTNDAVDNLGQNERELLALRVMMFFFVDQK